jgi:hypothetical protein
MPAFGEEQDNERDDESWALVMFIRRLPGLSDTELSRMKQMNPKSPMELAKEEATRRFLAGEDIQPVESGHEHNH